MSTTGIVVTGLFITLGIYDMIVVMRKGVGCSVSRFMQTIGFKSPIVCVVIGMLLGHFWMWMPPIDGIPIPENKDHINTQMVDGGMMLFVPIGISVSFDDHREKKKNIELAE